MLANEIKSPKPGEERGVYCLTAEEGWKLERRPPDTGGMLMSRWVSSRLTGPADGGFPGGAFLSPIIHHALWSSNTRVRIKRDTISPAPSLPPPSSPEEEGARQRAVTPNCSLAPVTVIHAENNEAGVFHHAASAAKTHI